MNFNTFILNESLKKDTIDIDELHNILTTKCSDFDIKKPFWRGTQDRVNSIYISDGSITERKSANTSNHYTVIIDEALRLDDSNHPLRSKSIICANYHNKAHAENYGKLFAVIPFNEAKIGVTSSDDIWDTEIIINDYELMLPIFNRILKDCNISDKSFNDIVNGITDGINKNTKDMDFMRLKRVFKDINIKDELLNAFSPSELDFKFGNGKSVSKLTNAHELWISGKCAFVEYNIWSDFIKQY